MAVKVFVLGRSGSGKSTAVRRLNRVAASQGWYVANFNDHSILRRMFLADAEQKQFRPAAHNGFEVLDPSVLDRALYLLQREIQDFHLSKDETLITIEFGRDDYKKALTLFNDGFWQDAYYLFIAADFPICMERIYERTLHPTTKDDYFVPDEIMLNQHSALYIPPRIHGEKIRVIDNTKGKSLEDLEAYIEEVAKNILSAPKPLPDISLNSVTLRVTEPLPNLGSLSADSEKTSTQIEEKIGKVAEMAL
jgi:energy-coupling factor transporter ATP-binding protein EcfA2